MTCNKTKQRFYTLIGLIGTIGYCIFIFYWLKSHYTLSDIYKLSADQLGTVLSGIFGPAVFLWLILNFFQQNISINIALEEKETAELLVLAQPYIYFLGARQNFNHQNQKPDFIFNFINQGNGATNINFIHELKRTYLPSWKSGEAIELKFLIDKKDFPEKSSLEITYTDTMMKRAKIVLEIYFKFFPDHAHRPVSFNVLIKYQDGTKLEYPHNDPRLNS